MAISFLLLCFSLPVRGQVTNDKVTVMSYNIRLDHAGDNDNNWHHRKDDMVTFVEQVQPSFLGVQEAIGHQLSYLDDGLVDYTYTGVGRDDGLNGGEYSAILYDSTRWKIQEANTFWLSSTPHKVSRGWDAACHRVVTYGVFVDNFGRKLAVLNTHFDHVGKIARQESLRLINQFVTELNDMPVLLMGDFNFTPEDNNYKFLTSIMNDTYDVASSEGQVGTFNGFGEDKSANRRIDYILTNDKMSAASYEVLTPKTRKKRQLSDHYPVIAKVQFIES